MKEIKIGRISFEHQSPRMIRVVKAKNRNETAEAKRERLDKAQLRLLVPEYPELVRELLRTVVK